jgi:alpha-N-arabinofuranosidase
LINAKILINRWNTEFKHRLTPDYYQTFGLGFMEYFLTAEDIGASPLPILNCGMACQYNTAEMVDVKDLDPYVQDALDLIEFANGDASTKWGKLRIDLGHPATFNLKMLGVGNEQWGEQYIERWKVFTKAIKTKYPDIKIVSALGPAP